MPPNTEDLLKKIYELERDNNRMLHAMRRSSFISGALKVVMWIVALIIPLYIYINYLGPALNQAMGALNQVQGQMQQVQEAGAKISVPFSEFSGILDGLKKSAPPGSTEP